jgi:protease I
MAEKSVLIFIEDGYDYMELMYPKYRLHEAGYSVVLAGPKEGHKYTGKHGCPCESDALISEMNESDFAGVILVGGWAADRLRRDSKVRSLIAEFAESGKLVAAIGHGGWMAISAGVYRGVKVTGSLGVKDDLVNAGAVFESVPVVVDRHFVSSRHSEDLPHFMKAVLGVLDAQELEER